MQGNDGLVYLLAADALLVLHVFFVAFVVIGLVVVLVGKPLGWRFIYHFTFRVAHLIAIAIVVAQSWLGIECPLTTWEMALREVAGGSTYDGAFVAHWLQQLLYYQAPPWVFTVVYTLFGALVIASWLWVPPGKAGEKDSK